MNPHVLFDFFGTLAAYDHRRSTDAFPRTEEMVPGFRPVLDEVFAEFERSHTTQLREFTMAEVCAELVRRTGADADPAEVERVYVAEWSAPVRPVPGLTDLLTGLHGRHRLAVVSDTHSSTLVPGLLAAWGLAGLFDAVVLSADVGRCKPHPAMYATAVTALGGGPAVFVGDSLEPDYRGPRAAGIPAYLIDPSGTAPVPDEHRLPSVTGLAAILAAGIGTA